LTPSTAYTEYCIHWVQHPPKIVCLPFILMITLLPLNVASSCGMPPYSIGCHQRSIPWEPSGNDALSNSNSGELINWWIES
jgi:hypothetical protein